MSFLQQTNVQYHLPLATAISDHTARVWEKASGQQIAHFPRTKSVYAIEFSLDGKYIVTASGDGTANIIS